MTPLGDLFATASAALLPPAGLAALAAVRDRPDVRVHPGRGGLWAVWPAGRTEVVRRLLAAPGATFFVRRGHAWYRFGSRLPASSFPPDGEGSPVTAVLSPARFEPAPPPPGPAAPVALGVVRGGEPRAATALACDVADLRAWADRATTAELAAVRAARCGRRAVLIGPVLPAVPGAVRYWGDAVLIPVGFRAEPDLPPDLVRAAAGAAADDLVLLVEGGAEIVARAAFEPLTRAGLRLALRAVAGEGRP